MTLPVAEVTVGVVDGLINPIWVVISYDNVFIWQYYMWSNNVVNTSHTHTHYIVNSIFNVVRGWKYYRSLVQVVC